MISDAWFHRIKAAQRDLIKLVGGIERAAEISSISKSHIGRMNNAADPELMPLSAVYALQAECDIPVVTSAMAELSGRRLSDPETDRAADICIQQSASAFLCKAGEFMSIKATASSDGLISVSEGRQMDRVLAEAEREIARCRQSLAVVVARGGQDVTMRLVKAGDE